MQERVYRYYTRNTALAAYLRTKGYELLKVERSQNGSPAIFVFKSSDDIYEEELSWQLRKPEGNLNQFFDSYRFCLRLVKRGKL